MKLPRRKFLHLAAGAAVLLALPRIALAQAYPTQPECFKRRCRPAYCLAASRHRRYG